jgi:peptidoglycan/LPS O-acetylase OafA/YrhL
MKINYRPEIDGLRAVAVISVILYHAEINIFNNNFFKGGFIGVDIFFVISGYLITSIILKELFITNTFSLIEFYKRRVRRILPPLLTIMIISMPLGWIYLLPSSFLDFSKSILYSLGFVSNFYFHFTDQQYGAANGLLKPFLHTWSLSVEEQFYILFPIFLLILFTFLKRFIFIFFLILLLLSIGFFNWASEDHRSLNFYMLVSRGWELIAGSILAYIELKE